MGACIGCIDYESKTKEENQLKMQIAEMVKENTNVDIARERCEILREDLYANLPRMQTEVRQLETVKEKRTHSEGFEKLNFSRHHDDGDDDDNDDDDRLSPGRGGKEVKLGAGVSEGVCSDPRFPLGIPLGTHLGTWCESW